MRATSPNISRDTPRSRSSRPAPPTTSGGRTSSRPARSASTASPSAGFASSTSASRSSFDAVPTSCSTSRIRWPTSSRGWTQKDRRVRRSSVTSPRTPADYDYLLFFSYRYYHAYHGARAASSRAILVPTAERDAAIGLAMFRPVFRGVRALMYNSPEERAMIHAVAGNDAVPGVVVGIGSDVPNNPQPNRFRNKYDIRGPFAIYVGRIDRNKGCEELFEHFQGLHSRCPRQVDAGADRQFPAADPRAPAHPPSRFSGRRGQVRRDGGGGPADHAVVLREPVDGGARSVGARAAGAGQRQVRRAEGPVHPEQRRALLRRLSGIRRHAPRARAEPLADRRARPQRTAVFPGALRLAGHRAEVPGHVRAADEGPRRAGRWSRCPAGSTAGVRICRPAEQVLAELPTGPALRASTGAAAGAGDQAGRKRA